MLPETPATRHTHLSQRNRCFSGVYQSSAVTIEPPAIESIATSFRIANLRGTRQLPSSQYGARTCEQLPGTGSYDVIVGAKFETDDRINFVGVVAGDDDWNI